MFYSCTSHALFVVLSQPPLPRNPNTTPDALKQNKLFFEAKLKKLYCRTGGGKYMKVAEQEEKPFVTAGKSNGPVVGNCTVKRI